MNNKQTKRPQTAAEMKGKLENFLAQRRQAYTESIFVAFCQNPQWAIDWDAKAAAKAAVEAADALLEALFIQPMAKVVNKDAVPQGE